MRVLGVDPGLSRCGVGVVEGPALRPTSVRAGVIRTPADAPASRRLGLLYDELDALLRDARPDAVAVERTFFSANVRTAMGVGQAAGVVLLCADRAGIAVGEYTPTQVKAAVVGHGSADKQQVAFMVRSLLRLTDTPRPPDAADALALALCHLHRAGQSGHAGQDAGQASGQAGAAAAGMSPRLAAAVQAAAPGAQIVQRGGQER